MSDKSHNYEKVNVGDDFNIDFNRIFVKIWNKRNFILQVTISFILFGLLIAFFSPNIYTASTTLVPQTSERKAGGSLSGLAAMAGINLGSNSSSEILSPAVYPNIISNVNFQKELIYAKFFVGNNPESISYYELTTNKDYKRFELISTIKKYTIGLPGLIISRFSNSNNSESKIIVNLSNIQSISKSESDVIKNLNSNLKLHMNEQLGYFKIEAKSYDPKLSAQLVYATQNLLQKYLTNFKLEKLQSNLDFIESSFLEAKANFESKQRELANFRDSNKSLTSSKSKTQEEKLISEYNLLLGIYTELAKQKEEAKISVKESTPLLTVVEPVVIPTEKSGPKRLFTLIGFTLLGIFFSVGYVFIYPELKNIFEISKN